MTRRAQARPVACAPIDGQGFDITFHGVRGSTPCHGDDIAKYGGNTSCVAVDIAGAPPILLDLGTGARYFGVDWPRDRVFDGVCLLSHLHWDHIQGLPFFPPLLRAGNRLEVHAPVQDEGPSVTEIIDMMLRPPMFPIGIRDFPGDVEFVVHGDDTFDIGPARVISRLVPHLGATLGFRISFDGRSVAYISDHQQPGVDEFTASANALELCRGADVLIHDAQYTRDEFVHKSDWGHCTVDYAMWLAQRSEVGTLVLYHHDPMHDDLRLDAIVDDAASRLDGVRVIGAREGLTLDVGR